MKGRQLRRDHKGVLLEKVPFLVVMLKSLVPQGNGACVTLKDSTGSVCVCVCVCVCVRVRVRVRARVCELF